MNIKVTQEHINKGLEKRSRKTCLFNINLDCPVAIALQEVTGQIMSGYGTIYTSRQDERGIRVYRQDKLPSSVIHFINNFDKSAFDTTISVKPFNFRLNKKYWVNV